MCTSTHHHHPNMKNIITAYRGINASQNRDMAMAIDGIHFSLDQEYASTYGLVVEAEICMERNLDLMCIKSASDFIARFACVGIKADDVVGEFIDGASTVETASQDWRQMGPQAMMGDDFTNFLGRHVRHQVDTITFPEHGNEADPSIIVLSLDAIQQIKA